MGVIDGEWKEKSKPEEEFWQKTTRLIENCSGVDGNYQLVSARNFRNKRKIWQSTVEGLIERGYKENSKKEEDLIINCRRIDRAWVQGKFEIRGRFDNQLSKDWSKVSARKIQNKRKFWQSTVKGLIERNHWKICERRTNQNYQWCCCRRHQCTYLIVYRRPLYHKKKKEINWQIIDIHCAATNAKIQLY